MIDDRPQLKKNSTSIPTSFYSNVSPFIPYLACGQIIGERERANLVVRTERFFRILYISRAYRAAEGGERACNARSHTYTAKSNILLKITLPLVHVNVSPRTESGWTWKNTDCCEQVRANTDDGAGSGTPSKRTGRFRPR